MTRDVSFRDAGIRSPLLRVMNGVGTRLAPRRPSLEPADLLATARKQSGLDDFGDPAFREGLDVLCEALEREAQLHTFGRTAIRGMLLNTLATRLQVIDWAARHPEVRQERIRQPFIVCGLPRTGTTLLSFLLDLDPRSRSILTWEAGAPIPPPTLGTRLEDPRIAASAKQQQQMLRLIPPIAAMHPFGATLPQECQPLLALDFRALQLETQSLIPSYGRWLEQTEVDSTYAMHELVLQILQHAIPTERWALKTPQHLWHLDTLFARYPDARLVWTHRDPARVIPSVASLNTTFFRTFMTNADPIAAGQEWNHKLHLGIERGMQYDDRAPNANWCCHLLYERLMDDAVGAVRDIYSHFGEEVDPLHERLMEAWIRDRPQSHHGRHRYDMKDFGFTLDGLDEQYHDYVQRYGIPREKRD